MSPELPSEIRTQRDRLRDRNKILADDNAELRLLVDSLTGLPEVVPPIYAKTLRIADHIAKNGIRRGEASGSARQHPESRPPRANHAIAALLDSEKRHMRHRATLLQNAIDRIVGVAAGEEIAS